MSQIFLFLSLIVLISIFVYLKVIGSLKFQYTWFPLLKAINLYINNMPEAREFLISILEKQKNNPYALWLLGNIYREKGWIDQAIQYHQKLLSEKKTPLDLQYEILFSMGNNYYKAGMLERALFYYQELISKNKNYLQAYYQIEEIYEELKDWQKAIEIQEIIVSKAPSERNFTTLAFLHNELGEELMNINKYLESIKEFRQALLINKKIFLAYVNMGKAYYFLKEYEQAMVIWEELIEQMPANSHFVFNDLMNLYNELGLDYKKQALIDKIKMQFQKNWRAQEFLFNHYFNNSEPKLALEHLLNALEIKPDSITLQKALWNFIAKNTGVLAEDKKLISFIDSLDKQSLNEAFYTCHLCGYKSQDYLKKCPHCHEWNSFI